MSLFVTLLGLFVVFIIYNDIMKLLNSKSNRVYIQETTKDEDNLIIDYSDEDDDEIELFDETEEEIDENLSSDDEEIPELLLFQLYVGKIMEEDPNYILKSYYDLRVYNDKGHILSTSNVFTDVSPQLLCLKLIHNISMIRSFAEEFATSSFASISQPSSQQKDLFLKLFVSAEKVDIVDRGGFGFIGYNIDDMAYALYNYYYAMEDYVRELAKEKKYSFLKKVVAEFDSGILRKSDPNTAIIMFISNNKNFYKEYIDDVKLAIKNNK